MLRKKIKMLLCTSAVCSISFAAADTGKFNTVYAEGLIPSNTFAVSEQNTEDSEEETVTINNAKLKAKLAEVANKGSDYAGDLTASDLAYITGDVDLSDLDITDDDMPIMKYLTGVSSINLSNNTAITNKGFNENNFDWTIPKGLNFKGCTGIECGSTPASGMFAFIECKNLSSIVLPESIKSISTSMFQNCTGLTSISIPDNTSIGTNSFSGCISLANVDLGNGIKLIGNGAFKGCTSLKYIKIPDSLTSMGFDSFSGDKNLIVDLRNNSNLKSKDSNKWGDISDVVFLYGQDAKLPGKLTLKTGGEHIITSEIPDGETVKWGSNNNGIAIVDENGKVTAVSPGTAFIYVKTSDDTYSGFCTVTVTDNDSANPIEISTELPEGKTSFKLGDYAKVIVKAVNNSGEEQPVSLILGLFDKDNNNFVKCTSIKEDVESKNSTSLSGTIGVPDTGNYELRAFVWDGLEDMKPLSDVKTIPVASTGENDSEVTFDDYKLEQAVRDSIEKPDGPLRKSDVDTITDLDISGKNISNLKGIENLTSLKTFDLKNNKIKDISELANLKDLQSLDLSRNPITNVDALNRLENLQSLSLGGTYLISFKPLDINGLSGLKKLTTLDLSYNKIEDINPLKNLTELQSLNLYTNKVSDISVLSGLKNLTDLNLNHNKIEDISNLNGLNLQALDLGNNQIKDVNGLGELKGLTTLNLSGNQISDISPLSGMDKLQSLNLQNNKIDNIIPLKDLSNLKSLDLQANQISDINGLGGLRSLTTLNLWGNEIEKIDDVDKLKSLTSLTDLNLNSNKLVDISGLKGLESLKSLELNGNPISDITPLYELRSLESVDLGGTQLNDISALANLNNLNSLNLNQSNGKKLENISVLSNLTKLQSLNLSSNKISDITPLEKLTALGSLELSQNQIADITALKYLTSLTKLDLGYNQISNITPLSGLTALQFLGLSENSGITDLNSLKSFTNLTYLELNGIAIDYIEKQDLIEALPNCDIKCD